MANIYPLLDSRGVLTLESIGVAPDRPISAPRGQHRVQSKYSFFTP